MSTRTDVYVRHHDLLDCLKSSYRGGKVDTINLDTDVFSFRDLDHFARNWNATWDGARNYVVKQGGRVVIVDLVNKTCDCRVFQLTGIPCPYAIAAIHDSRQQPMNFFLIFLKEIGTCSLIVNL